MFKKNKLFMLIILVIFMFIGISNVNAEEVDKSGLTCLYKNNNLRYIAIVQTDDELLFYEYLHEDYDADVVYVESTGVQDNDVLGLISSGNTTVLLSKFKKRNFSDDIEIKYVDVDSLVDENNKLTGCPNYINFKHKNDFSISYLHFRTEKKVKGYTMNILEKYDKNVFAVASSSEQIEIGASCPSEEEMKDYWIAVPDENKWTNACLYYYEGEDGCIIYQLNYRVSSNKNVEYIHLQAGTGFTFVDHFLDPKELLYFANSCPINLYGGYYEALQQIAVSLHNNDFKTRFLLFFELTDAGFFEFELGNQYSKGSQSLIINPNIEINDCGDLLSDEMVEILSNVVTYSRILVPLILVVLGIIDFGTAVFSGKEDDMKKNVSRFVKRVLICFAIFLVPSLLELLLTIAHAIWPDISPTLCGIL